MKRDDVVKALSKVLKPGDGGNWDASRAAKSLPRGLDPTFLRRVFDKLLAEEFSIHTFGTTLPDEYVPLARSVLAKKKTCDAIFLSHVALAEQPRGFRDAVKVLIKLGTDASAKRLAYLKEIAAVPEYVSAAQATVAVKGIGSRDGALQGPARCNYPGRRTALEGAPRGQREPEDSTAQRSAGLGDGA